LFFVSSFAVDESKFNGLSIYQVMVSTFQDGDPTIGHGVGYGPSHHNGDLQGIINSLDYIKDLGFNAIWMTPIFDSTGTTGNVYVYDKNLASTGYYPTDCFNVDPKFGGNEKLKELVTAAHARGIYVILDGVLGHNGGIIKPSPNGKWPYTVNKQVRFSSQDSVDYYKEVVTYWINNYEIDGWRLDMVPELIQDGHNYMGDFREAIYAACDQRKSEGKEWGTLGYVVGEYWSDLFSISDNVYKYGALKSAFDFPFRYNLVQALAQDENGDSVDNMLRALYDIQRTPFEKGYCRDDIYPNLFIGNHDTYRFGNLIRMKHSYGPENANYWRFHKIAIATLATYTGPITLYYGEEFGDITDCWTGVEGSCPPSGETRTDRTSSARTSGHISGYESDANLKDLHDFTKAVINARKNHPSMYRGTNGKTQNNNVYFNCKYDPETGDKVVFVTNCNSKETTVSYEVGGIKLYDFVTGNVIYSYETGKYNIQLEPYGTKVFQVFDEDVEIPTESTPDQVDECYALLGISNSDDVSRNKKDRRIVYVIAIAAMVVVVVVVAAIGTVIHIKRKYERNTGYQDVHVQQIQYEL